MKFFRSSNTKPEVTNQLMKSFSLAQVVVVFNAVVSNKTPSTSEELKTQWQ